MSIASPQDWQPKISPDISKCLLEDKIALNWKSLRWIYLTQFHKETVKPKLNADVSFSSVTLGLIYLIISILVPPATFHIYISLFEMIFSLKDILLYQKFAFLYLKVFYPFVWWFVSPISVDFI